MKTTWHGRILALLAASASGCSFAFVRGPPAPPIAPLAPLECSTSRAAPVADLVAGLGSVVLAGVLWSRPPPEPGKIEPFSGKELAPVFVGLGAVWAASSLFGFTKSQRCLDTLEAQRACSLGQAEACRRLQEPSLPRPPPAGGLE